jgi:hypothetical protein
MAAGAQRRGQLSRRISVGKCWSVLGGATRLNEHRF